MIQMWFHLFKRKYLSFTLCLFLLELSTEQTNGRLWIQRSSPNLTVVAQGQALQLNITLHGADETVPMLLFIDWNFRSHRSSFVKRLLSLTWDRGYVVSETFYAERASILDIASLLLLDTSLKDSGTYWCNVFSLPSHHYPVLYFNVTVQGKPTAEMGCPEQVNVTQGKNFTCWCNARNGGYLTAKTSWQMEGAPPFLGEKRRNGSVELFLEKVNKHMAGTYLCTAQLYSMVDEKTLILSVFYAPTIHSFRGKFLKDNSMKMTCLAKGFPLPTYVIKISNGLSFTADIHGVVIINDYKSVNESYTCIARNIVGRDQWNLNGILTISKGETVRNRKSFFQDHVWCIIGISAITGILFGILLLKTCQSTICKKSKRGDEIEQDSPVYVDPATLSMSEGRKKGPLNYIDVHVLPSIPQGRMDENMPVYVDPDTVVSSRKRLREARGEENRAFREVREPPEDDNRMYQAPHESRADENGESDIEDNRAEEEIQANRAEERIQANQAEEEIQANLGETNRQNRPSITLSKPRANTEPMLGYQDLDSSDEIEENFYHSLRLTSKSPPVTEYYVNERVKVKE